MPRPARAAVPLPLRTILVPLDGSALAEQALGPAVAIARASGATVHVATVFVRFAVAAGALAAAQAHFDAEEELEHESRAYLDTIARDVGARLGRRTAPHFVRTIPLHSPFGATTAVVHALHRLMRRLRPELVVMATHARGGVSRAWLGSVADALVRRGGAPLLLVHPRATPPEPAEPFRHLLVPLDGSARAEGGLPVALTLASLAGARATLLQVVIPERVRVPPAPVSRVNAAQVARDQADATAYLADARERFLDAGVEIATATVVDERPARAILAFAEQHQVDLIAISTRGHGGATRFMLGSVADKVLRGATAPILLARPEGREPARARD